MDGSPHKRAPPPPLSHARASRRAARPPLAPGQGFPQPTTVTTEPGAAGSRSLLARRGPRGALAPPAAEPRPLFVVVSAFSCCLLLDAALPALAVSFVGVLTVHVFVGAQYSSGGGPRPIGTLVSMRRAGGPPPGGHERIEGSLIGLLKDTPLTCMAGAVTGSHSCMVSHRVQTAVPGLCLAPRLLWSSRVHHLGPGWGFSGRRFKRCAAGSRACLCGARECGRQVLQACAALTDCARGHGQPFDSLRRIAGWRVRLEQV